MNAGLLLLLAFPLLSLTAPTASGILDLDALLAELRSQKFIVIDRGPEPDRDPGTIIWTAAQSGITAEATIERLSLALGIGRDGAQSLLSAIVRDGVARARRMSSLREVPSDEELRSIEADYRRSRDAGPQSAETLRSLYFFYRTWRASGPFSNFPDRLVADLRRSPDPGLLAMELLVEAPGDSLTSELFKLVPERYRNHPAVLAVALNRFLYSWAGSPLAANALDSASRFSPPPDRRVLISLAELQLRSLIDKGFTAEAIAAFERLAPDVANGVLGGQPESFRVRVGKLPFRGYTSDLRLDLAAAYTLEGRNEAAERIARLTESTVGQQGRERSNASQRALLRALKAAPSDDDPFETLADALGNEAVYPTVWSLVFARYAERGGYQDVAADKIDEAREHLSRLGLSKVPDLIPLPAAISVEVSRLRARGDVMQSRLARDAEAIRKTLARQRESDEMVSTMTRLLDAPRVPRYAERPLPEDVPSIEMSQDEQYRQIMQLRQEIRPPGDFALTRVDRSVDEIVAIGTPWGQSWTAEAGAGGYWLIRSAGGGAWSKPLYLGLRGGCPYSVRSASNLSLVDGGLLRIEVDAWEKEGPCPNYSQLLDGAPVKRSGIFVEIALSRLERDEDGDGLSDILEEDLFTDPNDPDTDGDGVDDRRDLVPNARPGRGFSPESDAIASVIEHFVQWRPRMEIGQRRPSPPGAPATRSWIERSIPRTFLFVGDRRDFDSRSTSARVLVLTPAEWKKVRERTGMPRSWTLTAFLLDRTKTRGVVRWSGASEWGALRLAKTDDGWRVESVAHVMAESRGPSGSRIRAAKRRHA
jgi:hypothetical protein